jgi:hypothetical protein
MDLQEIRCECVDYIYLAQDKMQRQALINRERKLPVPQKARIFFVV